MQNLDNDLNETQIFEELIETEAWCDSILAQAQAEAQRQTVITPRDVYESLPGIHGLIDMLPKPPVKLDQDGFPKDLFNLCDNLPAELIMGLIKGIKDYLSNCFDVVKGVIAFYKKIYEEIQDFWEDPLGYIFKSMFFYLKKYLHLFYCQVQQNKNIIIRAVPAVRGSTDDGKTGIPLPTKEIPDIFKDPPKVRIPDLARPKDPDPNNPNPSPNQDDPDFQDATAAQVLAALRRLRDAMLNQLGAGILQLQENEKARGEDIINQLLQLLPRDLRSELSDVVEPKTDEEKLKAARDKYLEGIEDGLKSIEAQIAAIADKSIKPADKKAIMAEMTVIDGNLNNAINGNYHVSTINRAIADLPPLTPPTPDNPFDVEASGVNGTVSYYDLLTFAERLTQKTTMEVLNNNIKITDSNNREFYQSHRKIIDAVKAIQIREAEKKKKEEQSGGSIGGN